jgi:predicted transposase YbfD/YdcC
MDCTTGQAATHLPPPEQVQSLYATLQQVQDSRAKRGQRYTAAQVLTLLILAKLAGEQSMSGIAQWVRLRGEWLGGVLGLHSLPCANTYRNVCAQVNAAHLHALLAQHFADLAPPDPGAELVHWAIDGKVLRGSQRQTPPEQSGQEGLGVYAVEAGYLVHCQPIVSKGYEAATAQAYVAQTSCAGKVITADALHTRPRLCRQIRHQQGHYVLLVKGNRAALEAEIRHLLALPPTPDFPVARVRTVEKGHGRTTIRQLATSSELTLALADEWPDVAQVFLLERWGVRRGKPCFESVCGLTSLPAALASPARWLALVQAHWQIENRCHWRRDATLGEDRCTVRHPRTAVVLAVLNAAILALLDHLHVTNVRTALRTFAAHPDQALALLTHPL